MNQLWHYSPATGDARWSPRGEVADKIVRLLEPLIVPGDHQMPMEGYQLEVDDTEAGYLATVVKTGDEPRPVVVIAVAKTANDAQHLWPAIESIYFRVTELPALRSADFQSPKEPANLPWCVAVPVYMTSGETRWVGDFERCLAWAWIER